MNDCGSCYYSDVIFTGTGADYYWKCRKKKLRIDSDDAACDKYQSKDKGTCELCKFFETGNFIWNSTGICSLNKKKKKESSVACRLFQKFSNTEKDIFLDVFDKTSLRKRMNDNELYDGVVLSWSEILKNIKVRYNLSNISFTSWLEPLNVFKVNEGIVYIKFPGTRGGIVHSLLDSKYHEIIQLELCETFNCECGVVFVGDEDEGRNL